MKLGSLFDGIGGFPLAATMLGIEPVWASEIEKNCIKVTGTHFPNMKHYGSVTKGKGNELEPVDIITFGSPCQDLSVAGKRAGLEGARSGLFMEAVRIIKEMRDGSSKIFPRYAVWENVPGAYSSNGGKDFWVVIESLAQVADPTVSIPRPHDNKWHPAGMVKGNGWSICWRTLDAQYWGVPQRRRRIFLVTDFGGDRASEIFFERESLPRDTAKSGSQREEAARGVEGGVRIAGFKGGQGAKAYGIGYAEEQSPTLGAEAATLTICVHATQDQITAEEQSHALGANSSQAVLFEPRSQDGVPRIHESGICPTLNTAEGGQRQLCVMRFQRTDSFVEDTKGSPLAARDCKDGRDLVITKENENASEIKNNTRKILFELRQEVGEESFAEWRFRMLDQLQQKEILQSQLHGTSVQKETKEVIPSIHDCSLSCQKHNSSGELSGMPEAERNRCSSQGRKLAKQCARELGATMPELPQSQAQAEKFLFDMSETSEGIRILRQALSEVQEVWQSLNIKSQTVRRLTPKEAERLQGFPDNWTDILGASDSARYKALGNSVAIPCVKFILSCIRRSL